MKTFYALFVYFSFIGNGLSFTVLVECPSDHYYCSVSNHCYPRKWMCDGEIDCLDGTDESMCSVQNVPRDALSRSLDQTVGICSIRPSVDGKVCDIISAFSCLKNGKCQGYELTICNDKDIVIPVAWVCDSDYDCRDGSDEMYCDQSNESCLKQGHCEDNKFVYCEDRAKLIRGRFVCDGDTDCRDGSDEKYCDKSEESCLKQGNCEDDKLVYCEDQVTRILGSFVCDGSKDCIDGSDEKYCDQSKKSCLKQGHCENNKLVYCDDQVTRIPGSFVCDGSKDCIDGSDEKYCKQPKESCLKRGRCENNTLLYCENRAKRIIGSFVCDGFQDCPDGSDEKYCVQSKESCLKQGYCKDKETVYCEDRTRNITGNFVCNGNDDCPDGSDEKYCDKSKEVSTVMSCLKQGKCQKNTRVPCEDGSYINGSLVCNGVKDCRDGSDEEYCDGSDASLSSERDISCLLVGKCPPSDLVTCESGLQKISGRFVCDGDEDCTDASDEKYCGKKLKRFSTSPSSVSPDSSPEIELFE